MELAIATAGNVNNSYHERLADNENVVLSLYRGPSKWAAPDVNPSRIDPLSFLLEPSRVYTSINDDRRPSNFAGNVDL